MIEVGARCRRPRSILAAGSAALGARGLTRLLVEGGATLAAALLRAGWSTGSPGSTRRC
jgi:riboflavin biosynthesis pyrimidine reductase